MSEVVSPVVSAIPRTRIVKKEHTEEELIEIESRVERQRTDLYFGSKIPALTEDKQIYTNTRSRSIKNTK